MQNCILCKHVNLWAKTAHASTNSGDIVWVAEVSGQSDKAV